MDPEANPTKGPILCSFEAAKIAAAALSAGQSLDEAAAAVKRAADLDPNVASGPALQPEPQARPAMPEDDSDLDEMAAEADREIDKALVRRYLVARLRLVTGLIDPEAPLHELDDIAQISPAPVLSYEGWCQRKGLS
ncbi:MAG TPA: hypothetical protein VGP72_10480 [Planctomycetota bacterium]|jgi:hypothetical protein